MKTLVVGELVDVSLVSMSKTRAKVLAVDEVSIRLTMLTAVGLDWDCVVPWSQVEYFKILQGVPDE